jgi:hypothetical protein
MKKILLVLLFLCSNAFGQAGFETGNLNGWTTSGVDTTASQTLANFAVGGGKTWTINPYGSWMGKLYPSGSVQFNSATTSLGLTSTENTAIRQFMTANAGGGDPTPTNASWMKRTMTLTAGTSYSFAWNYLSTDYTPYNDGSMVTLVHSSNAGIIPTLNNSQQRYGLLGFTNPGTGNYATDSYGSTGWQKVTFTVPVTGDYVLGFATFNLGDTTLSPMLFVDEIQGTTLLNGAAFTPIAPNPGSTAPPATPPDTYTTTYSTQTTSKLFGNRTINYSIPMKTVTNNSTGAATTSPVTPATVPSGYISIVPYTGGGGWQNKTYTYTATTTGTGYLMFAFRHDPNYWVIDNVSIKANNTGANLLVNGGLEKSGMMTVNVGGSNQTVAAPTAWGLAYQTNQSATLGGGFDSGMWYDTSTGSYGAIYQNVNFTAGVTYTISFMVASDYNSNGDTVQMAVYAGSCEGESTACTLPASTGMTTAVTPSETYTVGCTTDCPVNPGGGGSATWPATSEITTIQTTQRTAAKGRVANNQLGNSIYLDQKIGSSGNTVNIEQTGNYNKIAGLGGTEYAVIDGDNNTFNIKQGDTLGKNLIEFSVTGNTNNITLWQARNPTTGLQDGQESGGHYMGLNVNGSTNTLSLKQSNDGGTSSGHFAYVDVTGNNNTGTLKQTGNGEKTFFGVIVGNTNVFDITQQGSGSYFDLSLTGNGHTVTANQKDAGSHKATVNLTNAGGSSTVTLVQQGATAQNINITQQCATLSGCSVSVTQGQ